MDPQVNINFICQRCRQLICLDAGFSHLTQLTLAELALPIYAGEDVDFSGLELDKVVMPLKLNESNGQALGFTIVGESTEMERHSPLKVSSQLFDLLSTNSDTDHPLCEECTDGLLDMMDDSLKRTQYQAKLYEKLFTEDSDLVSDDLIPLEEELKRLEEEEAAHLEELAKVQAEQVKTQETLAKCFEEKKRLDEEEKNYWREYCTYKTRKSALENENRSLRSSISYMQHQLDRLRQTNVFNATFHIWYSGYFGTINNLRLGRLPTAPVTWTEINAAWGQIVLLLASLANKAGFQFSKFRLVPHGNTSYIEVLGESKELPLYGSGGLRFLWDNKFDAGMVAFLKCAEEFQHYIENNPNSESKKPFYLPYKIKDQCIQDINNPQCPAYPIKIQFNSEEQWTKCLKFLLTNLKWALTWVSSPAIEKPDDALAQGN